MCAYTQSGGDFSPPSILLSLLSCTRQAANNLSPFRETNVAQNWEEMRTEEEEEATVLCIRTCSGIASFWSGKDWEIGCGRGGLFVPMCGPRMEFFFPQSKKGPTALCNNGYSEYGASSALGMQTRWALTGPSSALICSAITNENIFFYFYPSLVGKWVQTQDGSSPSFK